MIRRWGSTSSAALAAVLACAIIGCARSTAIQRPAAPSARPRPFISTFDRILIAGFVAAHVSDGGRDLDVNVETARLIRTMLRTRAALNVIESQPMEPSETAFGDAAFWKRIGEEYREPLIVTGTVNFRRAGPQVEDRQLGPRSVAVPRPRFQLDVRLVLISGRTGEVLDTVTLEPVRLRSPDGRPSISAIYFEMMERLTPAVVALF